MRIDRRRDHSIRIPRPDRTVRLGTPNACNDCHANRPPEWAAAAVRRWFPNGKPGFQVFAEAFHAAERGAMGSRTGLLAAAANPDLPPFARASALRRLEPANVHRVVAAAGAALADSDAVVRLAAVQVLATADEPTRALHLPARLADPARVVRMDAARALAGPAESRLDERERERFESAIAEFSAAERFAADRPEGHLNLAGLWRDRGRLDQAESSLRRALAIDPTFEPAAVDLADLLRQRGREAEAERALRDVLARRPRAAAAHHALGLSLARQRRLTEALPSLEAATRWAPGHARYAYVYGVALRDAGRPDRARAILDAALAIHPNDRDLLEAAMAYDRADGRRARAERWWSRLRELEAADP
jgi:tetratricopeptide (TPR) repeat protein